MFAPIRRGVSLFLISLGIIMLAWVGGPLLYSFLQLNLDPSARLIDPSAASAYPVPVILNSFGLSTRDYTAASSWFATANLSSPATASAVAYFSLSYPKIGLDNIMVEVNGSDLRKNPIHYPGTALPGVYGNAVIFGHSALPQFYVPGSPLTIFNHLPQAQIGDRLSVTFDGITYNYQVKDTAEVKPSQIEVLAQRYDRQEITLITCVPLGTYWKRFVVRAELISH